MTIRTTKIIQIRQEKPSSKYQQRGWYRDVLHEI